MKSALGDRIAVWVDQGFRVVSETPTSAQLVRPKQFSAGMFVAMPLLYVLDFANQREASVYISIEPSGELVERKAGMDVAAYRRIQSAPLRRRMTVLFWVIIAVVAFSVVYLALGSPWAARG